ncbi:MAG: hypothetical protein K0S47_484 [Herbinix sp.]|jgi:two-component system response regulator YesN|nr:hypothetical protein [Herbinix sp.]
MFSILIADDEKIARADILYKVSRSGFVFKWVMEAASAEEALEMIKEHNPDILLTDICMGEMSGIDLVRSARTLSKDLTSILISGYPEFSYAKEAIALDVVDYILKPVRQEELTGALSKAVTRMMQQRNLLELMDHDVNFKGELLTTSQREQLHAFLNGIDTKLDFSASLVFPENTKYYQIGLIRISYPKDASINGINTKGLSSVSVKGSTKQDNEWLRQQVKEIIRDIGGQWFLPFNNFAQQQLITVIAASPNSEYRCSKENLTKIFEEIYLQLRSRLKVIIHMGVSTVSESVSGTMMTQARQALDLRLSLEGGPCGRIYYWDNYGDKMATFQLPEDDVKLYQCMLSKGDLNKTLDIVRRIFSTESPGMALHIRMLYVDLICFLARTCIKKVGGSVVSMLGPESLGGGIIDQFSNREEMIDSLCRTITTALSQWMAVNSDASVVLQNVKNCIENNFTDSELSTSFLSNKFCISLGYLSNSYKNEFGVTISKYIISLRLDYAKKLLEDTRLSIAEIAENSGFNNVSYFMRTFKKCTGDTPAEYREKSHMIPKDKNKQ